MIRGSFLRGIHSATAFSSKGMHTARDIIQNYMSIEYFLGEIHPTSEFIST
jgi:hypothetical protein